MSSAPSSSLSFRAGAQARLRAFPKRGAVGRCGVLALCFFLLWCCTAGPAEAQSYPPKIGCFVDASTSPDAGLLVRGIGFGAGQRVLVEVGGRVETRVLADRSGSFQASLTLGGARTTGLLTASDATCRASSQLSGLNGADPMGAPEPVPPVVPAAATIPSVPPAGLTPQLFLGVAGGLLLAGTALTGLTGRIGHR